MSATVRPALFSDIEAVRDIERASARRFIGVMDAIAADEPSPASVLAQRIDADGLLVAEADGARAILRNGAGDLLFGPNNARSGTLSGSGAIEGVTGLTFNGTLQTRFNATGDFELAGVAEVGLAGFASLSGEFAVTQIAAPQVLPQVVVGRAETALLGTVTEFVQGGVRTDTRYELVSAEAGRFPRLDDRDDLWQLLLMITSRKASRLRQHEGRQRRGGGQVVPFSALEGADPDASFAGQVETLSREPDPALAAEVAEQCRELLASLGDAELGLVALRKLEGYRNAEIARQLGRSVATVERKLQLIRSTWEKRGLAGDAPAAPMS